MPIDIDWKGNRKNILLVTFPPRWNWDEFKDATEQTAFLLAQVQHTTDIILDLKNSSIPVSGSPFEAGNAFFKAMPANRGVIIVVTNTFIRSLASIFRTIDREFGDALYPVNSLDEAYSVAETQQSRRAAGQI
ncbi:MAG: hypothetical protein LCI00_18560 [Chloroflexi bacterium]|nr:hypothetical protein [Chloroflexota bacterium]MCC6894515.1 hypothetical protein [Anaerolineae bacterium]